MSVESEQLERSVLERKDRDELHKIAVVMGGKPGSRARKAEIIDLILDLAGVTSAPEAEPVPSSDPEPAAPRPRGGRGRSSGGNGGRSPAPTEADADVDAEPDAGADAAVGEGNQRTTDADARSGDAPSGDQSGADGSEDGEGGGGRDDGEAGNRRRRRRGRDRDRGQEETIQGEPVEVRGLLDLRDEGYGFLRVRGYLPTKDDVYVSVKQVRQFGLRKGDQIKGASRPAGRSEKNPALLRIDEVNGQDPEAARERPSFEDLTPVFPAEVIRLERTDAPDAVTGRILDLVAPLGKGQRGLVVSPPKAGKSTLLKDVAAAIGANHPELTVIVVLVDERPEEVTDLQRSLEADVVASTFDRPADEHTMVAELTLERAKRLVEGGEDVVVILDGLSRLARAFSATTPASGRAAPGGLDPSALHPAKKLFGAARNLEEGGSLTVLATVQAGTGSPADDLVVDELVGAANMEVRLDAGLAERRTYPAIDVRASSTRHEERLYDEATLVQVQALRRELAAGHDRGGPAEALALLTDGLAAAPTNAAFLADVAKRA